MDEKTKQAIKERFAALPQNIREIILSSNYEETLIRIGKEHNLTVEQLGILEIETTMVMLGLVPPDDFEEELSRELGVDKEKGARIASTVNRQIFLKIREQLKLLTMLPGDELENPEPEAEVPGGDAEKNVLDSAGIEILDEKAEPKVSGNSGQVSLKEPHAMVVQKLAGPVQMPRAETAHSLENISRPASDTLPPATTQRKDDPYREPIE